jgi:ABC-type nitrate/sulfonate/bicarbonate transport system substrate-binding protein
MGISAKIDRRQLLRAGAMLGAWTAAGPAINGLAHAQGAAPLKIVNLNGNLAPVFDELLRSGRYFEQLGVATETANVADGTKVMASLVSDNADLSAGSGVPGIIPAIEHGARIKIVAASSLSPQVAIFSKRDDIREAKDLVGKTVGTGPLGAQLHGLAVALLTKKGVDHTKVNFVNIGAVSSVFTAVAAGTVDAGFGTVDVFFEQQKYGVHALTDGVLWKELPGYINQVMLASDKAIAGKRPQLVKALAAYAKLFRFINTPASKEAWIKARAAALHKDQPKEAEAQWTFFNTPGVLATNLTLSSEQLEFIQKVSVDIGAQDKVLPFNQVADMSLAEEALKLLG